MTAEGPSRQNIPRSRSPDPCAVVPRSWLLPRPSALRARQYDILGGEYRGKHFAGEERIFPLAQGREGIETAQIVIDEPGMAHHHAAVRQAVEEVRKECREIRIVFERVGAGKAGVGAQTQRSGA